jgi:putative membrane-bound dehydrogenase-like protein
MRFGLLVLGVLPLAAQMSPPQTVKGLKTAEGLETTLFAAEALVANPTNLDIDEKGRIWYLESVNYRRKLKNLPDLRKTGDRIVILEDTNGDGKADRKKIFYESPDLRTPLGIAILGNRVVISQSPSLIVLTRDDQDRVVNKEVLLTGWGGVEHDHGLHAVTAGPDGRYYFAAGDLGFDVTDKSGRRFVSSKQGPYYAGTALRINPDGTGFTVLGHNFRNPYELAQDSFGGLWQSDNDDDGNAWTRFNYVLPGGNYGYWGPGGRSWREDRGTHFHQENPGVVPNIARLGAGSPCGLVVYEGKLLPERYRGQPIHAEAGKKTINTYFIEAQGAGYRLTAESTVVGADPWFRPTDVAVAPDGAVYIADWYDPVVGGHNIGDPTRGRIYRLAPVGYQPRPVKLDLESGDGLLAAFASPNQATRYLAWEKLKGMGEAAAPLLRRAWEQKDDPILRVRALWLLPAALPDAMADPDVRFRLAAIRVAAFYGRLADAYGLKEDRSPAVRRELAALLRDVPVAESAPVLVALARQYNGEDRWYLEALGIGMDGKPIWPYLEKAFAASDPRLLKLAWRLRAPESMPFLLSALKRNERESVEAIAAQTSAEAAQALAGLFGSSTPMELKQAALEQFQRRLFSEWSVHRALLLPAIARALGEPALAPKAVELAADLEESSFAEPLAAVVRNSAIPAETRAVALVALGATKSPGAVPLLLAAAAKGELSLRIAAVRALGAAQPANLNQTMQRTILSQEPNELRSEALKVLARSPRGANAILDLEQKQELPAELRNLAASLVNQSRDAAVKARAARLLPPPTARNKAVINPRSIVARQGDVMSGRKVYFSKEGANCALCHAIEGTQTKVGPSLASIGSKLGKEALLDAILNPSSGIAHEYQTWILDTRSQGQVIGVIAEDTPRRVTVKNELGEAVWLKPADIKERRKSNLSIMPEDLVTKMSEQDLVDLLEFLTTLKGELAAR